MEQAECSETSAYNIQTTGNYPEEKTQHTEHGESLKPLNGTYLSTAPWWPKHVAATQFRY